MCAAYEFKGQGFRPGREVPAIRERGVVRATWAGFARNEILDWWQKKGGVLLDLPATRFAERSEITGKLIWDDVPEGLVIRGLLDHQTKHLLIKVVTRASTPAEMEHFQHPRMPLLETPLFASCEIPLESRDDLFA